MNIFSKLLNNKFSKNVLKIASGTVFAQILNILLSPVIMRIYSPESYGYLTVFTAIMSVLGLVSALAFETAIPVARNEEKAVDVFVVSVITLLLFLIVIFNVLSFASNLFLGLFGAEILHPYRYWIVAGLFFTGLFSIFNFWAYRKKDFNNITLSKYSQSLGGNLAKIGFGLFSSSSIGLILGRLVGQFCGIILLIIPILKSNLNIKKSFNRYNISSTIVRYKKFPLFSTPTLILISMSSQIPIIFISKFFGSDYVGFYGLAISITFLPVTFIGKSIQDVFYSEAASVAYSDPVKVKKLSNSLLKKLILLGLLPMAVLFLFGPQLFSIVYGNEWLTAGIFSRLLTLYVFSYLVFHPVSVVFSIYEKQNRSFYLNIIKICTIIGIFYIGFNSGLGINIVLIIFSIAMSILEVVKYVMAQVIINDAIKRHIRSGK